MALLLSRILPWWPHILFVILEPLALLLGAYQIFTSPSTFLSRLIPASYSNSSSSSTATTPILPAETAIITLQLSNTMLLLSLTLPLILTSLPTTSPQAQHQYRHSLARAFLLLLSLADLGHVYATYAGTGTPSAAAFWDVGRWNGMLWGQVGGSLFLCVQRLITVVGGFGRFVGEGKARRD